MIPGRAQGDNPAVGIFMKVIWFSSLQRSPAHRSEPLVWYLALELVGVDGVTRYVKEPVHQSYLWQVAVIYTGPFVGLLAGSVVGWRGGHVRREPG